MKYFDLIEVIILQKLNDISDIDYEVLWSNWGYNYFAETQR